MTRIVATVTCGVALAPVLVVSGVFTVRYLFGWQWARAEFAAVALVASLVLSSARLVMTRLRRIEQRLDERIASLSGRVPPAAPTTAQKAF